MEKSAVFVQALFIWQVQRVTISRRIEALIVRKSWNDPTLKRYPYGRKRDSLFIDSLEHLDLSNTKEKEADAFAVTALKSKEILIDFGKTGGGFPRLRSCIALSVLGCLQHHGRLGYRALHKLKPKASALLPDDCKMK